MRKVIINGICGGLVGFMACRYVAHHSVLLAIILYLAFIVTIINSILD